MVRREPEVKVNWIGLMPHPDTGRLVHLGGRNYGKVYAGAVHYEEPSGGRVMNAAIKIFREPLSREKARAYERAIADLKAAGWPMEGVFMHEVRPEDEAHFHELDADVLGVKAGHFVQVTPLKGSLSKGSDLVNLKREQENPHNEETLRALVKYTVQAANVGYAAPKDFVHLEKKRRYGLEPGVWPWDIDLLVAGGKQDPDSLALHIDSQLYDKNLGARELDGMKRVALRHAKGEQKKALLRLWPYLKK